MNKKAIIYLHGFNSASLDAVGQLLTTKDKLRVLRDFCAEQDLELFAPNVDYRDFENLLEDTLSAWNQYLDRGLDVVFMGSSMGGVASDYLARKTACKAIMINPVISPCELLPQFIGVSANYETGAPYQWEQHHCDQYALYQAALASSQRLPERLILLDMGDELLDAEKTRLHYADTAKVVTFVGGSHGFEHMQAALPAVTELIFSKA